MAGLLVSVRSAEEARAAAAGGAAVIDVKEPARGPLGRADAAIWRRVRAAVSGSITVSIALGEIGDWRDDDPGDLAGISFRKLGLAGSGPTGADRWREVVRAAGPGPRWAAVCYLDWGRCDAPGPDAVIAAALAEPGCAGVLFDTFDKDHPSPLGPSAGWLARARAIRAAGRFLAIAGGLDLDAIARLAPLGPDLYAVRGSACRGRGRLGPVDAGLVAGLVAAARAVGPVIGKSFAIGR